ncbi:MAG: DUF6057 family protein [Planctomycetota bacterium]
MWRFARARWWQHLLFGTQFLALLAVFYLYVLLRIQPHLLYHQDPVVFLVDADFFFGFLARPGGIVDYLSAFLSTTLAINWLGSLVITALATLICLATRQIFNTMAGVKVRVLWLVPALLILTLLGQYVHLIELCTGLAVALSLAAVYLLLGDCHNAVRLVAFLVLSVIVYFLTAGLYLVFACLCGIYELGVKRHLPLGALGMLCVAMVPLAGARWFDLSFRDACGGLTTVYKHWLALPSSVPFALTIRIGLLLFFPVVSGVLAWRQRFTSPVPDCGNAEGKRSASSDRGSNRRWASVRWAFPSAMFVAILIAADFLRFDFPTKCLWQMVCSAEARQWDDVLACYERLPPSDSRGLDVRTKYHVNRALYYTGDLPGRMFSYPHFLNEPTLALVRGSIASMAQTTPRQCSEILFDLGRINESEQMAHEALEFFGDRRSILKRLVYINVIKGRPEAARRFLAVLECSLLHGSWARRLRRRLDRDPSLSDVPEIASRRDSMVKRDSLNELEDLESMLLGLLERNPRNRMAFEYLMAHYLLTRQVDKLVANLQRLDDFEYPCMPRHYEEALIVHLHLQSDGSQAIGFDKWKVRQEAWQLYAAFIEALQPFSKDNVDEAYKALHGEFGDSYFFFYLFGTNYRPSA